MEEHDAVSISDNTILFGQVHFTRKVSIPLAEALEDLAKEYPLSAEEAAWTPDIRKGCSATLTGVSGLATILMFIGSWAAKKALDELYEGKLKQPIRTVLASFFASDTSKKKFGVSLLINKLPERISIMVAIVGHSLEEIERGERQVRSVIRHACDTASAIAKPNTVHLYVVEDGAVNGPVRNFVCEPVDVINRSA